MRNAALRPSSYCFGQSFAPTRRVVLEATGDAPATARILEPHVPRSSWPCHQAARSATRP
jgi:hypothetical protein